MKYVATGGLVALGMCFSASQATATDSYPTNGLVHSQSGDSALQYDCVLRADVLECDFTQTMVRRQDTRAASALRPVRPQRVYFKDQQPTVKECNGYQLLISALKSGEAPIGVGQKDFEEGISWFASVDGEDLQAVTSFFSEYCKQAAMPKSLNIIRPGRAAGARACSISTRRFSQRFVRQTGANVWSAIDTTSGACSPNRRDRFVPDTDQAGQPAWNYVASSSDSGADRTRSGKSCSNTALIETAFGWQPRNLSLGCDIVKFSAF